MTSRVAYGERRRQQQDAFERHVHDEVSYDGAGMIIRVAGNGTEDQEVQVLRIGGVWLHLPKGTNADVFLFSNGVDQNGKVAMTDVPRDKHRKTRAGTSGIQHPTKPDIAVEISDLGIRVTGERFAVGKDGAFEVKDGDVYVRKDLHVGGVLRSTSGGSPSIPGFESTPDA